MFVITKTNTYVVKMMQWAITDSASEVPILATFDILSSVALTFYCQETKQAVLIHLSDTPQYINNDLKRIINIIWHILLVPNSNMKLIVDIAATTHYQSIYQNVLEFLLSNINVVIRSANVINCENCSTSNMLAINARTGETRNFFNYSLLFQDQNFDNYFYLWPCKNNCRDYRVHHKITNIVWQTQTAIEEQAIMSTNNKELASNCSLIGSNDDQIRQRKQVIISSKKTSM